MKTLKPLISYCFLGKSILKNLVFIFLMAITISSYAISVKFSVDMSYQISDGTFHSSTDKVYLKGSFNSWSSANEMIHVGNGVYSVSINLNSKTWYDFKFFTDAAGFPNSGWELNVGIAFDNRNLTTGSEDLDVGKVFFNNANLIFRAGGSCYDIYCADNDAKYVSFYQSYLDENVSRILKELEAPISSRVKIWIYPERKSFMLAFTNPVGPDWVIGFAMNGTDVVVVSPDARGGDPDPGLVGHEFTHIIVNWKSNTYVPPWLNEGAACYLGGEPAEESFTLRRDGQIKYLIDNTYGGNMPELSRIENFDFADYGGYPLATSVADFVINTYGIEAFADFILDVDFNVLGFDSKAAFQTAWHNFLKEVYLSPQVDVKFQVDMSYYIRQGLFDPEKDKVYVGGTFGSWLPYLMKAKGNGVYSMLFPAQQNKEYQYKFMINSGGAANEGWEELTDENRVIHTTTTDTSLLAVPFNNLNPTLSMLSPNGGESFISGDSATISWKYTTIPTLKIEYSADNGANWILINPSLTSSKLSIKWKVPDISSSTVKIRITDTANGSMSDTTDQTFSIVESNEIGGPFLPDEHTVALLHFDNNFENVVHQSSTGFANSNISFVPSFDLNHGSCVKIDNTNSSVFSNVEIPFYDQLSLSGSWTIDFWFNIKSWGSGTVEFPCLFIKTGANYFVFLNAGKKTMYVGYDYDGGAEQIFLPDNSIEKNTWYHLTFIRNTATTELKCLLHDSNLQLVASASGKYAASHLPKINIDPLRLGGFSWGSNLQFDGYADELRISNIAREFRSLSITAPNGGETLTAGTKTNITWASSDIQKVKLEFTTNNGSSWTTIASDLNAASGSYNWTIPNTTSAICKIRISDQNDNAFFDDSNQAFSIVKAPVLTLTKPAGGECWQIGSTQNITWNSEEIATCMLEYSTDNGELWQTVSNSIQADNQSYSFKVPDIVAYEWKFRISDASNSSLVSISNGLVVTYGELPPSVEPLMSVEYPVFSWPLNAYYPITTTDDDQAVNGRVGNACGPTVVANLLRYWEFPLKGTGSRSFTDDKNCTWSANFGETIYNYDKMLSNVASYATQDEYDAVATMMYHAGVAMHNPYRTGAREGVIEAFQEFFNYSRKSKFLYRNDYTPEQWDKIFKSEFAHKRPIIIGGDGGPLPEGGVAGHWFICDGYNSSNKYHIRWDYGESSNEYLPLYEFKPYHVNNWAMVYLEPELHGKQLTLTSPSGFENWQQETKKTIMWSSSNVNYLNIEFSTNNGYDWSTVASNVSAATGSYAVTVPSGVSNNCKIRITDASDINIYDRNTIPFSIYDVRELTFVQSFSSQLQSGCNIPLRWNSKGIQQVTIEYSTNSGSTWTKIADTDAHSEEYLWKVPEVVSANCKIRVSDKADNSLASTSTLFSINGEIQNGGPYCSDESTILLLHLNGNYTNEATSSEDGIPYNTIEFENNYELGLDKCLNIDNSGSSVFSNLEVPHYSALSLKNDWKIELWFKIESWGSGSVEYPSLLLKPGANYFINPQPKSNSLVAGYDFNGGNEQVSLPANSVSLNKWYHVTFIRNTTTKTLELILLDSNLNKVSEAKVNYNPTHVPKTTNEALHIGGFHMGSNVQFNGFVDEVRITGSTDNPVELTVKFSVDLNYQITNGIFKPTTDKVYLKGSFNGWSDQNPMSLESNGVYTCTVVLDPSTSYQYKYFINSAGAENGGWEITISDGENGNRVVKTETSSMVLLKDYFNNKKVSATEHDDLISYSCYPNPFVNSVNIGFTLSADKDVSLKVYDIYGRVVSTILSGELSAGKHLFKWSPVNLPFGLYVCKFQSAKTLKTTMFIYQGDR